MAKKIVIIVFFSFFIVTNFYAQDCVLSGQVIDAQTGETLPGASVFIKGTTIGTSTDLDGKFCIKNLPAGKYDLVAQYISYATKCITGIELEPKKIKTLKIALEQTTAELQEVIIQSTAQKESITSMLMIQKNSVSVSDGISSDIIKKTPDKNTSDVLKRVSGTTIQDNKFVIVRGLNDRYNAAFINDAPLPSSESDRKAFSFDIFPTQFIDNVTIIKTATPDITGDFSGGVIMINTRSIPEENAQNLSISSGYNTLSTLKPFYTYPGGNLDFIGMDNGSRNLPKGIPSTTEFKELNSAQQAEMAKLMPNNWALIHKNAARPNTSMQYAIANNTKIFGNNFGSLMGITYINEQKTTCTKRGEFEESSDGIPLQTIQSNDTSFINNIVTGFLANFSYNIGKNSKLSFKNQFNINAEDKVVLRNGIRDFSQDVQTLEKGSLRSFTENKLYSGQLSGEHLINDDQIRIKWMGSYSHINRSIPNLRRMIYTKPYNTLHNDRSDEDDFLAAISPSGTSPSMGGNIFYSENNEKTYNAKTDVSKSIKFLNNRSEIKAGYFYQQRQRSFSSRQFGFSRYNKGNRIAFDKDMLALPEEQIFNPENLGEISPYIPSSNGNPAIKGVGGFKLEEVTKLNDTYYASAFLNATYLMVDNRFSKKIRFIWGARLENYKQTLESFEDDGGMVSLNNTVLDILPSINGIYSLNEKCNLRMSFSQTVSRPEFRELAPFGFFDYTTLYSVRGNPELKRAKVNNYDARFETYPTGGQVFSVSVFYKDFSDAIEQVNRADVPRELYYQNVSHALNTGIELEYRLNLATLFNNDKFKLFNNTTIFSNIALINSKVDTRDIKGAIGNQRALQGQSPYVFNAGIQYYDRDNAWGGSLVFNQIGRRIAIVGNLQEPDTYENPSPMLDFQISKTLGRFDVKLNFKDILASKTIFYQDINRNKKYDRESDNTMAETSYGRSVSFGISYKIR